LAHAVYTQIKVSLYIPLDKKDSLIIMDLHI